MFRRPPRSRRMADAAYTQDNRPLSVSTPLGKDKLLLESMTVVEAISEPFLYTLSMLAPAKEPVAFEKLLAQKVTVTLLMIDGETKRYFSGVVTRISQGRPVRGIDGELSL